MKRQIEQLAENYKIESIHIDQKQKREGKLDNGIPYFVIPIELVTTTNARKNALFKLKLLPCFIITSGILSEVMTTQS